LIFVLSGKTVSGIGGDTTGVFEICQGSNESPDHVVYDGSKIPSRVYGKLL